MAESQHTRLLVLWPYVFRDFDWQRLQLDELNSHVEVVVWDLSAVFSATFSSAYSTHSNRCEIRRFEDVGHVERSLGQISDGTVVITAVPPASELGALVAGWRRRHPVPILGLWLGGVPLGQYHLGYLNESLVPRLVRRLTRGRLGIYRQHRAVDVAIHGGLTSLRFSRCLQMARASIISAGSFDQQRSLLQPRVSDSMSRSAVLLDTGFPAFATDAVLAGKSYRVDEEKWYLALEALGRQIERCTGTTMRVAVHPKHAGRDHSRLYPDRDCIADGTVELVNGSAFVLTTNSTSTGLAVLSGKPILVLDSRQLDADPYAHSLAPMMARETGARVFNIDEEYTDDEIRAALVVDEAKYARYTRKYLTTRTDDKRNYEILLEEVIWPYAELYRAEQERTGVGPDGPLGRRSRKRIIRQLQRRIRERNDVSDLLREAREMKKVEDAEWREWRRRDRRERRARTRAARAVQAERAGA